MREVRKLSKGNTQRISFCKTKFLSEADVADVLLLINRIRKLDSSLSVFQLYMPPKIRSLRLENAKAWSSAEDIGTSWSTFEALWRFRVIIKSIFCKREQKKSTVGIVSDRGGVRSCYAQSIPWAA